MSIVSADIAQAHEPQVDIPAEIERREVRLKAITDLDSRIMKRAGGGFDASYKDQTAADDTAHIIVAAERANDASDVGRLVPIPNAVKSNTGKDAEQAPADAGYRGEKNFEDLTDSPTTLAAAMGREGKQCA